MNGKNLAIKENFIDNFISLQGHYKNIVGWYYLSGVIASGLAALFDSIGIVAFISIAQSSTFNDSASIIHNALITIHDVLAASVLFSGVQTEILYTFIFISFFLVKTFLLGFMLMIIAYNKNYYMLKCRENFYEKVNKSDYQKIQSMGIDRIVNVGTEHINQSGLSFNFFMHFQAQMISIFVYALFLTTIIDLEILYYLSILPLMLVPYVVVGRLISRRSKINSELNDNLSSKILQYFYGYKSLKFGVGGKVFLSELFDASKNIKYTTNSIDFYSAWVFVMREPIIIFSMFILLGAQIYVNEREILEAIIAIAPLILVMYRLFNSAIKGSQYLNNSLARLGNVEAVSNTLEALTQTSSSVGGTKILSIEGISAQKLQLCIPSSETFLINNKLDIDISLPSKILIMGASGSGKTTLVDTLIGLVDNYSGNIKINNMPQKEIDLQQSMKRTAYVEQSSIAFTGSVMFNITFETCPSQVDRDLLNKAIFLSCLDFDLKNTGLTLETIIGKHGWILSGGQKQRLALARAFYQKAEILVLDEVNAGFDKLLTEIFMHRLQNSSDQRIILFISHKVSKQHLKIFDQVIMFHNKELTAIKQDEFDDEQFVPLIGKYLTS